MNSLRMSSRRASAVIAIVAATGLAVAACTSSSTEEAATETATESETASEEVVAAEVDPAQWDAEFDWGTFSLNPEIAQRVTDGEPLRVVLSMQGTGIPVFGRQQQIGVDRACAAAQEAGINVDLHQPTLRLSSRKWKHFSTANRSTVL
jgi:hypothetical protein